ncbi:MAG TPA: FecR family protein [Steroidobacteraceae bacterium]|jgi:transmembrane sensor|nr:FecR family protein [Steroidobacteraceae bacterium]
MKSPSGTPELSAIRAQAAVWVTDLHGPERSPELEEGVRRWLAEDRRHAQAFESATEAWQRSGNLPPHLSPEPRALGPLTCTRVRHRSRATCLGFAGAALLTFALSATFYLLKDPILSTGFAEQRTVELSDGSEVTLNANSRLSIDYTDRIRQVTLDRGEVLFNVKKHQSRPFVVIIGNRKVIALGTSFEVRREDSVERAFAVTLIEGRVAIEPIAAPDLLRVAASDGILLNPGQRLHFAANTADVVDTPAIDKVTAWRQGQLIFEDASIREAAKEFNRYGKRRISIDTSVSNQLRVGGVFRIGDPDSFAHAMASAYHLRIIEGTEEIKLTAS